MTDTDKKQESIKIRLMQSYLESLEDPIWIHYVASWCVDLQYKRKAYPDQLLTEFIAKFNVVSYDIVFLNDRWMISFYFDTRGEYKP